MINEILLTLDGRIYSLLKEQPTLTFAETAEMSLEVKGSEPQYGVEIKCFIVYPPPPQYSGCSACGTLKVPDAQKHRFVIKGDTFSKGEGRLEFVVDDFVGTVIRVAAVMQRLMNRAI